MRMSPQISIIIPTLNESSGIAQVLAALQGVRAEVIVVDGGSTDDTADLAAGRCDRLVSFAPGRARQQNAGAAVSSGGVLLFLHADTRLPEGAVERILDGLERSGRGWGRFDVRLTGRHPVFRILERLISLRSRLTGIATGDQAIFVRRDWFERVGGFPEIPLMEDVALSRSLKRLGRPLCLRARVTTSSRRWEARGIARTVLLMWRLRLEYWMGADPALLAARYR